jgi:hypothetical protein
MNWLWLIGILIAQPLVYVGSLSVCAVIWRNKTNPYQWKMRIRVFRLDTPWFEADVPCLAWLIHESKPTPPGCKIIRLPTS